MEPTAVALVPTIRPNVASETPVAIRPATKTRATNRTPEPADPMPACSGRPTRAPTQPPACRSSAEGLKGGLLLASCPRPQKPMMPRAAPRQVRTGSGRSRSTSMTTPGPGRNERDENPGPTHHGGQPHVDAVTDRAEGIAPDGQGQQHAERDEPDRPQVRRMTAKNRRALRRSRWPFPGGRFPGCPVPGRPVPGGSFPGSPIPGSVSARRVHWSCGPGCAARQVGASWSPQ